MKPFEFSPWTLVELEFVHATHGGGRGRVDNSGNRKLGRALGSVMGLPFEFAFGGSAVGGGGTSAARTARMMQQIDRTAKRAPQVVKRSQVASMGHPARSGRSPMSVASA